MLSSIIPAILQYPPNGNQPIPQTVSPIFFLNNENLTSKDNNLSDELTKLNDLRESGVLTQEEFDKAKNKLLNN